MLVVAPHAVGTSGFYRRRRHHSTEGALMHSYIRTVAAVLFAALVVTAVAAGYARRVPDDPRDAFTATRDVVAKFQNLAVAKKEGYGLLKDKNGIACIAMDEMPAMGAMGVHYASNALVGDGALES